MTDFGAPQFYHVKALFPTLGSQMRWQVCMNNAVIEATFDTLKEAQRDAARRNYAEGCYQRPQQIGL